MSWAISVAVAAVSSVWSHKNLIVVKAQVPLSEMNGYVTVLRSMTQGKGTFNMSFFNYEEVPKKTMDEIIAAAQAGKEE